MPFQFTLKALLRLRESLERAELQRLQAIASAVVRQRAEIQSLDENIERARSELMAATSAGISGAELNFVALGDAATQKRRGELLKQLTELEAKRREQQGRYALARQKREILSNLRERKLSAYELEQLRREQQQIDEIFLIRRGSSADQ